MKPWNTHDTLMKIWETAAKSYFDVLETLTGHHHHNTKITTKEDANFLSDAFRFRFGKEGDKIFEKMITSEELNGGKNPEHPDEVFPHLEYSFPLSFYFARRAMNTESNGDAYDILINDIKSFAEHNNRDTPRLPSQNFVEDLCGPYLEEINQIDCPTPFPDDPAKKDHDNDLRAG